MNSNLLWIIVVVAAIASFVIFGRAADRRQEKLLQGWAAENRHQQLSAEGMAKAQAEFDQRLAKAVESQLPDALPQALHLSWPDESVVRQAGGDASLR